MNAAYGNDAYGPLLWRMAGIASAALGFVGIVFPLLPGLPLLLLASWCFRRAAGVTDDGGSERRAQSLAHRVARFFREHRRWVLLGAGVLVCWWLLRGAQRAFLLLAGLLVVGGSMLALRRRKGAARPAV
jgi:hypothetical protein